MLLSYVSKGIKNDLPHFLHRAALCNAVILLCHRLTVHPLFTKGLKCNSEIFSASRKEVGRYESGLNPAGSRRS